MDRSPTQQLEWRKSQIWWILLPLVMAAVVAVLFPWMEDRREEAHQETCLSNMENVALWMLAYAAHNDGMLPMGPDWVEEMGEHIKDRDALICPAAPASAPVSYVFNPRLYGANLSDLEDPHSMVVLYEGQLGEIVNRHRGGANYAYADGFVEWREAPPEDLDIVAVEEP